MVYLKEIYEVSKNLRGKASQGWIRPTIAEFFTSKDFKEIERIDNITENAVNVDRAFSTPGVASRGIAILDNGDMVTSDFENDLVYVHIGVSEAIRNSFASTYDYPWSAVYDSSSDKVLLYSNGAGGGIETYDYTTGAAVRLFSGGGPITIANGNLIGATGNAQITEYIGINTSNVNNVIDLSLVFAVDGSNRIGDITSDGTNLIVVTRQATAKIYVFDGISNNLLFKFDSPGVGTSFEANGVCWDHRNYNLLSSNLGTGKIYVHNN